MATTRRDALHVAYSVAPYASVQKSVNTFCGSDGSIMRRCLKAFQLWAAGKGGSPYFQCQFELEVILLAECFTASYSVPE
jgi:hypothetical protein